ncbi:MAG TPA: hypothetical protein VGM21_02970 [Actinomycetota bacterium]
MIRPPDQRRAAASQAGIAVAALLALAVLAGNASPGFPLAQAAGTVGHALGRNLTKALHPSTRKPAKPPSGEDASAGPAAPAGASRYALADIPRTYLALYQQAGTTCPKLAWQTLAGIGKVETNHGRSQAPGVHTGLNSAGCCAGPMQFNLTNGPPSTWAAFGRGNVYDPTDAIPAAARKLCANGLAQPPPASDPCPQVLGSAALHVALLRYNNACWYVHEVVTLANRYTTASSGGGSGPAGARLPASSDPFVQALTHNPRITTTSSHGCDPAPDLASGRLDLRVQSILVVIAQSHAVRISCLKTGHSEFVKGTTRVSNHWVWRAVDLDRVDGQPVSPTSQAARRLVAWLDGLEGPLRPAEVGSPWAIGHAPYFTDEGHQEHVHIGYSYQQTPG